MHRSFAAACAAYGLLLASAAANAAGAQVWNDARSRALVERATARRAEQLADTGLKDYKAVAHGYVTFLAQIGEGLAEPPRVVKADELVNEVYWRAPNLSKQRILGRRDTLLLPTDIAYHRDHLGIVQNNFPAIIRLGDGDEVVDVPHPLSPAGLETYDFAITDSLTMHIPGRTINALEVKVRPRDDRAPRIVGALYIESSDAQVVRMAFNFTRAAFRDDALEDLFVVVENSLVNGRFWLPRRQELEIRRGGTWLDYPIRGIIRGRWEIGDYQVNVGLGWDFFAGPEITFAPKAVSDTFHFGGRILDSLPPDVRVATDADIRRVQEEARTLVRAQALRRPQSVVLSASGVSDFVRFDRAEGFAAGAGATSRFGGGFGAQIRARYGVDDRTFKGSAALDWQSAGWGLRVLAIRDFREVGDIQERSRIVNSLSAQEFGGDATDPYAVLGAVVSLYAHDFAGANWHFDVASERQHALSVRATPSQGAFEPLVPATPLRALRFSLFADRPTAISVFGSEIRTSAEFRLSRATMDDASTTFPATTTARGYASIVAERPFDNGRVAFSMAGGVVGGTHAVPPQEWLYFGGPVSSPGYAFHEFASLAGATTRIEWRTSVPVPSVYLGRFGRAPGQATLAPFVQATYARPGPAPVIVRAEGVYPAVGLAVQPFFELVRLQFARGMRNGRGTFSFDVSRDFWGIL